MELIEVLWRVPSLEVLGASAIELAQLPDFLVDFAVGRIDGQPAVQRQNLRLAWPEAGVWLLRGIPVAGLAQPTVDGCDNLTQPVIRHCGRKDRGGRGGGKWKQAYAPRDNGLPASTAGHP